MRQIEIDALPEVGGFERVYETLPSGVTIAREKPRETFALGHSRKDPALAEDSNGKTWRLGLVNGVMHKAI